MSSLGDLQDAFAAALLDPQKVAPAGLRPTSGRRFAIHRNNRAAALVEALEAAFPAVRRLAGAEFFRAAARVYIDRAPPRSPVMLLYGESFGAFLDGFPPTAGVPYLGDVARLEWARLAACHAADAASLSLDCLATVPEAVLPALRLALHPSLRLVASRFPVASLWSPSAEVDMTRREAVAVLRPRLSVEVRALPPGGHAFVAALAAGETLGVAAGAALAAAPESSLAGHLQGLFAMGAVVALDSPLPNNPEP